MNVIFISPNFPPNFYNFCKQLKNCGANVLAIGDAPYHEFRPELKEVITEYCQVNMLDYDDVYRSIGYLISNHGQIDRIDSHNEFWLDLEAKIRDDFNIPGQRVKDILINQSKLGMKKVFQSVGVPAADVMLITDKDAVYKFIKKHGFPVIIKPDKGVGASNTYKIKTREQLDEVLNDLPSGYIIEPFIEGQIVTFDGLADRDGNVMFFASFELSLDVLSSLKKQKDSFYYYVRDIDPVLEDYGRRVVKGFALKERFFHCEFFRTPSGEYKAIEINVRCPGGYALDMQNYSCDIDIYKAWADLIVNNNNKLEYERKYNVATVLRRDRYNYKYSPYEVMKNLGSTAVVYKRLPEIFAAAMGNDTFILRHKDKEELFKAVEYALEKN